MKNRYLLLVMLNLVGISLFSQIPYGVYQLPFQPLQIENPTSIDLNDDQMSGAIQIGFDFSYFGQTYSELSISSNGYVSFDPAQFGGFSNFAVSQHIPSSSAPNNAIFFTWCDLNPGAGGQVNYGINGTAPNRVFIVEYDQVALFACNQNLYTGQLHLYEGSNNIDVHITAKPLCNTSGGLSSYAIEGIQNQSGTEAFTVPGRNNTGVWQAFNDAWRFDPDTVSQPSCIMAGSVLVDFNGNCIMDEADYAIPGQVLIRDQGLAYTVTNSSGVYSFEADTGMYQIGFNGLSTSLPFAQIACPTEGFHTVDFQTAGSVDSTLNFFIHPDSSCADIRSSIMPLGPLQKCAGNTNHQVVSISNHGLLPVFGYTVSVTMPDSMSIMSSVPAYNSQDGNTLTWIFTDTLVYGEFTSIHLYDSLDCYTTNLTSKCMNVTVSSEADCNLSNNESQMCQLVNGSYDPNHIQVKHFASSEFVYESIVQGTEQWYTYKIEFQNTGTAPAQTVVITDVLPSYFDYSSAEILASSHPSFLVNLGNGTLRFVYNNIALVDSSVDYLGSIGSVLFRVKALYNLLPGQEVANQASIVFDVNEPIITNEAIVRVEEPSYIGNISAQNSVYPNPATDVLYLTNANAKIDYARIIDITGKQLKEVNVTTSNQVIQLDGLGSGIYFVELFEQSNRVSIQKFVLNRN